MAISLKFLVRYLYVLKIDTLFNIKFSSIDQRILICASAASSASPMATGFAPRKPTT